MKLKKSKTETGTAVVETALTLLLFFTFLLGIMEAGRLFHVQQTLTDAAREGARWAVAPVTNTNYPCSGGSTDTQCIRDRVQIFLGAAGITLLSDGCTVSSLQKGDACITTLNQDEVIGVDHYTRVKIMSKYQFITLSMFSSLSVGNLKGEALMRNETTP